MLQLDSVVCLEDEGDIRIGVVDVFRVFDQRESYRRIVVLAHKQDVSRWARPLKGDKIMAAGLYVALA